MKRTILVAILISMIVPITLQAQKSGLTVSFKSHGPINGTSVGIKLGPLAVFGGLDIARISAEFESSSTSYHTDWYYDSQTGDYVRSPIYKYYESSSSFMGSALLAIPHVGGKLFLSQSPLISYIFGAGRMVIPSVEGSVEEERRWYDVDGDLIDSDDFTEELEESDKEQIYDALDFIGITLGFGVEYPLFGENFTVGGEYGLMFFSNSYFYEGESTNEDDDGIVIWKREWEDRIKGDLGITNTSITLNYYF